MRNPPGLTAMPRLKLQHDASSFAFLGSASARGLGGGGALRGAGGDYNLSLLSTGARAAPPTPPPTPLRGAAQALLFWLVLRLKYVLLALPLVAALLGVYAACYSSLPDKVPIDAVLLPPIITCVFFVLALTFSQAIGDYKESEKIPSDFVAYFSSLATFAVSEARQRGFSARPLLLDVQAMLLCVLSTLDKKRGYVADLHAFHEACVSFKAFARAHGVHETETVEHAAAEITKKITRLHDIGRLSIILPAYTLMDILVVALAGIVVTVAYKNEFTNFAAISVLFTVAVYMNVLVHGLDDPFDGPPDYHFRCYCLRREVELTYAEAWRYGLAVNFACLTADFGSVLRRLIAETTDGDVAAGADATAPPPPPPEHGLR